MHPGSSVSRRTLWERWTQSKGPYILIAVLGVIAIIVVAVAIAVSIPGKNSEPSADYVYATADSGVREERTAPNKKPQETLDPLAKECALQRWQFISIGDSVYLGERSVAGSSEGVMLFQLKNAKLFFSRDREVLETDRLTEADRLNGIQDSVHIYLETKTGRSCVLQAPPFYFGEIRKWRPWKSLSFKLGLRKINGRWELPTNRCSENRMGYVRISEKEIPK